MIALGRRALLALCLVAGSMALSTGCSDVSPDTSGPGTQDDPGDQQMPPTTVNGTTVIVHTATDLYKMDSAQFNLEHIGSFGIDDQITDIAITPDGRLFGISGEALYEIDANSAAATYIADVPGDLNVGLTFLPNGQLLATDKQGSVREISPSDGSVTELGKFGGGWGTAGDLVAVADGTMFAIGEHQNPLDGDSDLLLTVDTATGQATYVGELGYSGVFGSAFANGNVYAFTEAGEIIQVDPYTGQGTIVRQHPDVPFWGAAVSPLVTVE